MELVTENAVAYTGILKLSLSSEELAQVKQLQATLPEEAKSLDDSKLHVTLIHQSILKPFKKALKGKELPPGPKVILDMATHQIIRADRTSWIVLVKNWKEMQIYVDGFMVTLGGSTQPEKRVYHVSLANLTGSPFSSVGDVKRGDINGI